MSKRLIVGNWKMNPGTLAEAKKIASKTKRIASSLSKTEVVICPPMSFVTACIPRNKVSNFSVGAQTVSFETEGAHTGEVTGNMLKDIGVSMVIVGHSEQRTAGDTDEIVSKRLLATLSSSLTAILCVGENSRDEGGEYLETLKNQIKNSLANIPKDLVGKIIIAYEPVWAIGGSEPMNPEQIYEMSLFVKKIFAEVFGADSGLKVKVLYGGSVNFRNASDIITIGKVDGLLVGRESVNTPGFVELIRSVDKIS